MFCEIVTDVDKSYGFEFFVYDSAGKLYILLES